MSGPGGETVPAGGRVALAGGRALVTGASSGIGAATARALAARQVRLALTGRNGAALEALAAALPGAVAVAADLTLPGAPADVVARAVSALGGLDIVVASAGAGWAGRFTEMTASDIDGLIDLNLRSTLHLLHAALPHLVRKGRGHVVVIGSIAGLLPVGGEAAYSATKAALAAMVEALRMELHGTGVKASLITPGVVDTAFFDRRNRPYDRGRPKPIPADTVADAVADCLEHGRAGAIVPSWLALPVWVRGALPGLYETLARRFA